MPIVADLDDLSGAEFLMTLALNRKTGRLAAESGSQKVQVVVREGSIVYAASTGAREAIGAMLVRRGLIRQAELEQALDRQRESARTVHLGNILVEMGALSRRDLEQVVQTQFQDALRPFLAWSSGVASFERMDVPDLGAVHVDPREIVLESGLSTEHLVLTGMTELDDARSDDDAGMESVLAEMSVMSLSITSEMASTVLEHARRVGPRALLFLVHPDGFRLVDGFGEITTGAPIASAEHWLARGEPDTSLIEAAIAKAEPARGPAPSTGSDVQVLRILGGPPPVEAMALPVVVDAAVVGVLWIDSGDGSGPLADATQLHEVLAATANDIGRLRSGGTPG